MRAALLSIGVLLSSLSASLPVVAAEPTGRGVRPVDDGDSSVATARSESVVRGLARDAAHPDLASAIRAGNARQVRSLLESGANPNQRDSLGATPLHDAVWAGRGDLAQLLLDRGASANTPHAEGGSTPLDYAVLRDDISMARLLLAAGGDVNAEYPSGVTPLQLASSRGNVAMMELLAHAGAKIRHRDKAGSSPLDEAASRGNIGAVRFLASNGAEIDAPNPDTGATPLNEAACRGDAAIVTFLMKSGASSARRDFTGSTPLENAARFRRVDAIRALLALDPGVTGRQSGLLDHAVLRGDIDLVRILLDNGADVNARGMSGSAPLDDAALKGYTGIARLLLDHGAEVDSRNVYGATALHDAALAGHVETAGLLLDRGADVNARESDSGSTALYTAAAMGHSDMVDLLLTRGANPTIVNKQGNSPEHAARVNGFAAIADYLGVRCTQPDTRSESLKARLDTR